MAEQYTIDATNTSIEILERLIADGPQGVTTLAENLDLAKSAVHNHLSTLQQNGFVVNRDGTYEPSMQLLKTGNQARANLGLSAVRDKIANLAEATGETTVLAVEEDGYGVPLYVETTARSWRPPFFEGERLPLHSNAAGKAILSTLPQARVRDILDARGLPAATDRTITDAEVLQEQINRIQDDGTSFSKEEQYEGTVGVAAPLPRLAENRAAAVSVVGSAETLRGRYLEEDITGQVVSTAKAINVEINDVR